MSVFYTVVGSKTKAFEVIVLKPGVIFWHKFSVLKCQDRVKSFEGQLNADKGVFEQQRNHCFLRAMSHLNKRFIMGAVAALVLQEHPAIGDGLPLHRQWGGWHFAAFNILESTLIRHPLRQRWHWLPFDDLIGSCRALTDTVLTELYQSYHGSQPALVMASSQNKHELDFSCAVWDCYHERWQHNVSRQDHEFQMAVS